ncbi:hypothetical protein TNCV_4369181 [Trichonephila clavipes]|nr:hypothetical protein TNCV_4369181 [Trichonephila clavipes]
MSYEVQLQFTLLYHSLVIGGDSVPDSKIVLAENGRGTTGRVFVWQTPAEAFHVDHLVATVEDGGGTEIVWGAISSRGLGHIVVLE